VANPLTFRLHPLATVLGGLLEYTGKGVREALRTYRDVDARAGDDLSCQAQLTIDETLTPGLSVAPCYSGSEEVPDELRALRSRPGLVTDGVRRHSFLDQQAASIEPWAVGGGYANYMQADETLDRVAAAFGTEGFDRLRALKTRYDPGNVLHRNNNIPPLCAE
jgi:hypothetical protein